MIFRCRRQFCYLSLTKGNKITSSEDDDDDDSVASCYSHIHLNIREKQSQTCMHVFVFCREGSKMGKFEQEGKNRP